MGGWKKRRPSCKGVDRSCASGQHDSTRKRADVHLVLPHQRPWPTSKGEKADDGSGDTDWCTLPPDDGAGAPSAYGEGGARVGRGITASRKGRWQGLSGMQGNLHVPFLGGWAGAIPPGYPAMGKRTVRQRALCLPSANSRGPPLSRLRGLSPPVVRSRNRLPAPYAALLSCFRPTDPAC